MRIYLSFFYSLISLWMLSQHETSIKGRVMVFNVQNEIIPINAADVSWKEHNIMKTTTDSLGYFELAYHAGLYNLIISKNGFQTLEMPMGKQESNIVEIFLTPTLPSNEKEKEIDMVVIRQKAKAVSIKSNSVDLTYNISKTELMKAACCNLAESFETNPTVDVSITNAATGAKQIKLLGLDQKYTSITIENMPAIRGLTSSSGINFLPGTWINSIQLTKGGSTVNNGYEAITGQINTELSKFEDKNFNTLNFYANENSRLEFNNVNATKLDNNWSNTSLIHLDGRFEKKDMNHDGFLDSPLSKQVNVMNIIRYDGIKTNGWGSMFAIQGLYDKQIAGQKDFRESTDRLTQNHYGIGIENSHFEVWNKTGYVFLDKSYQSIGLQTKFISHSIDSYFGQRAYTGNQNYLYTNLVFESIIGNTNHKYFIGGSFVHDHYDEDFENVNYKRTENVPGIFAEYTDKSIKDLTVVAGMRIDFHNLAGTQFMPRLNVKYSLLPNTTLRLVGGRGMRTANIFAENMQYFASSRKVEIIPHDKGKIYGLDPEIAWNYGASIIQNFNIENIKNTISLDFFRTDFEKQVLVDLDKSSQELWFYNLQGKSFSNSFQTVWDIFLTNNLEFHIGYKWYDVKSRYLDGLKEVPFSSKNRGLFTASYSTRETEKKRKWSFDGTLQYIGEQRLPDTSKNPDPFKRRAYSPDYVLLNMQISRHFSDKIRVYIGAENLGGYKQKNPIIEAENPFGSYFDSSIIYAPIMSTIFYMGFDIKM